MKSRILPLNVCSLTLVCCALALPATTWADPPPVTAEVTEAGVRFLHGNRPLLFYQRAVKSQQGQFPRSNYVHPLFDLQGQPLTEDFPADHKHHRGIFWAWHQVLVDGKAAGDAWVCKDFQWHEIACRARSLPDGSAVLRADLQWRSPAVTKAQGDEQVAIPLVEETAIIRAHPPQTPKPTELLVDFEIRLRAIQKKIQLGGSNDAKGYGGFSPRIKLSPETKFLGPQGVVQPQRTAVDPSPWIDITQPDGPSLAILVHPTTPGYPQPWILRQGRSMQNAAWPGRQPVDLPNDQPLIFRYRLVVHHGVPPVATVAKWHQDYANLALPNWDKDH